MGVSTPEGTRPASSVSRPARAGPDAASEVVRGSPMWTEDSGRMSTASAASPATAEAQRQRTTPRAQPDQYRLGVRAKRRRGQSSRCPAVASRIGSRVSATADETSGISSPA